MRFIEDGPDIPDQLISAQEKGEVVFFCGAGISCDVGLPDFECLVKKVSDDLAQDYDKSIPLEEALRKIERKIIGGRENLLRTVWKILQPENQGLEFEYMQNALLDLAQEKGKPLTRIVTTNFDRLFEKFRSEKINKPEALVGAKHQMPKRHQWNGIVYLHGLLPDKNYESRDKDQLILTSSDFGQAYMYDKWATEFVIELFKNYNVCFVGYSLNDPVMRTLTEAVAASEEEEEGENILPRRRYALIEDKDTPEKWSDRGIDPIPYNPADNHYFLKQTLFKWRDYYVCGLQAKKEIVQSLYQTPPTIEKPEGGYKTQFGYDKMMLVLRDPEVTSFFANLNPRPPFEWLYLLKSKEFDFEDLPSFGHSIISKEKPDNFLHFSLLEPKVKFEESSYFYLYKDRRKHENSNINNFYQWIARHLDNPQLALEFARSQTILNDEMKYYIRRELNKKRGTEKNPDPPIPLVMRKIWQMFLNDEIQGNREDSYEWYDWEEQYKQHREYKSENCLALELKRKFQTFLEPKLTILPNYKAAYTIFGGEYKEPDINKVKYVGDFFQIEIGINIYRYEASHLAKHALREEISVEEKLFYINIFCDTINKIFEFGNDLFEEDTFSEIFGLIAIDNIFSCENDRFYTNWHFLAQAITKLLWQIDEEEAKIILIKWTKSPYIIFHKMAVFCLTDTLLVDLEYITSYLTKDSGYLLREYNLNLQVFDLLKKYAKKFTGVQLNTIQRLLLKLDSEIRDKKDNDLSLPARYLLTLEEEGVNLSVEAKQRIKRYQKDPNLKYLFEKRKPVSEGWPTIESSDKDWIDFLKKYPITQEESPPFEKYSTGGFYTPKYDDWSALSAKHPKRAFDILKALLDESDLPIDRWERTFFAWNSEYKAHTRQNSEEKKSVQTDKKDDFDLDPNNIVQFIVNLPDKHFIELIPSFMDTAKTFAPHLVKNNGENTLNTFLKRTLQFYTENKMPEEPATDILIGALNSSAGKLAELIWLYQINKERHYKGGLKKRPRLLLETLLNNRSPNLRLGRCIIARYAVDLFLFDHKWTKSNLIPLFKWKKEKEEALYAWSGYLSNARWTPDFISSIRDDLLKSAKKLNKIDDNYVNLLGVMVLYQKELFSLKEIQECLKIFDTDNLIALLSGVEELFESTENRTEFWRTSVKPFFKKIWPSGKNKWDQNMEGGFIDITLLSEHEFPDAVRELSPWIAFANEERTQYHYRLRLLLKGINKIRDSLKDDAGISSNYVKAFPKATLELLYATLYSKDGTLIRLYEEDFFLLKGSFDQLKPDEFKNDMREKFAYIKQILEVNTR